MTAKTQVAVPFAEPPWKNGLPSFWLTPELKQWQEKCHSFIQEHLTQHAWDWEKEETIPAHVFETFSKHNMLIPSLPAPLPVKELHAAGIYDILGTKVEDFTNWHNYIYGDELISSGLAGPSGSLTTGMAFGKIEMGSRNLP